MKFAALLLTFAATCAYAAPFELKDGDRVLLLGDALLERENTYGVLETRMHEQFPNIKFTVRNLSWSGETPKGWSRASFDGPEKGWERLKEQIAEVKPTVAILGFGMAASLQEMTDRSGDQTLNPDPVRYGAEPMSAARFKKELGELMDAINERTPDKKSARFVLLSPIKHEDLRKFSPGTPDPAPHNALLEKYSSAIKELAGERQTTFLNLAVDGNSLVNPPMTDNGISLSPRGYHRLSLDVKRSLGWDDSAKSTLRDRAKEAAIQAAILKKNDLFFHQFRPANSTYLFGFRKHEQGRNAEEMPKFTPLIEATDAEIDRIKRSTAGATPAPDAGGKPTQKPIADAISGNKKDAPLPVPNFTVADGFELTLWADTDLVGKPVAMNWDAAGRLWVACSPVYPQIEPGAHPHDKVVVLEDSDHDGKADKSTTFASNLLIAAGVAPDFTSIQTGAAQGREGSEGATQEQKLLAKVDPDKVAENNLKKAADPEPQDMFVDAFLLFRKAEGKEAEGDQPAALQMYRQTEETLNKIKTQWPKWQPAIIDFRLKRTTDAIERLKGKKEDEKKDGAAPALLQANSNRSSGKPSAPANAAAYVGSSTELVRVKDTNGDGIGDERRIILSGFGTEDTHHTIHTLRWGPDGRLYFNQSIYIHSHMETPWGMVRLNSGGICAYDPHTERVEVFARGFINTWGHAWDQWGQSFATDGAGFEGVHWIIPGAMYRTYEGARRILPSISPGTYPKYCGLELIQSPLFPEDWQGNAITCDFRAHKITRFQINDLSQPTEPGKEPLSGYVTKELPNPVVTTDASFRPIDVKLGPDGALYIADWTNPIINHGEVDFRDPRRDHTNGRIWRLAPKGKAPLKWESLTNGKIEGHFEKLTSSSAWEQQAAQHLVGTVLTRDRDHYATRAPFVDSPTLLAISAWEQKQSGQQQALATLRLLNSSGTGIRTPLDGKQPFLELQKATSNADLQASIVRIAGDAYAKFLGLRQPDGLLNKTFRTAIASSAPRIRVEAMRALARIPTVDSAALILEAALNVPGGAAKSTKSEDKGTNQFNQPTFSDTADPYYGYAAWLSINDLDDIFLKALTDGTWKPDTAAKQQQLAWALGALRPEKAGKGLSDFIAKNRLPKDGSGPWIELIGEAGGSKELQMLYDSVMEPDEKKRFNDPTAIRALNALDRAARTRKAKPDKVDPFAIVIGEKLDRVKLTAIPNRFFRLSESGKNHALKAAAIRFASNFRETLALPDSEGALSSFRNIASNSSCSRELRDAALAACAQIATPKAFQELSFALESLGGVVSPDREIFTIRTRIVATLFAIDRARSLPAFADTLHYISGQDDAVALALWRDVLTLKDAPDYLAKNLPTITKNEAAPALRAARELGKRGEKLVAALTPLAGEAKVADVPMDVNALVDLTKKNGNPAEGELIYRRTALTCTVCHAIGGAGGKVGPDLGTIGASAPLDYIIESTVNPAAKVKEGFHAIAASLKDGRTLSGTIAKETDRDLVLRDMTGAEQTVEKSGIKERTNIGSLMPAGLIAPLNDREKANLFAFMAQLGKPGPFDASKSNIARTWRIYPGDQVESVVANKADPTKAVAVHSLVDGRVTKELLEIPLAVAGASPTIIAAAKFSTLSAAKSRLHLAGITKAWLDGAPLAIASDPNPVVDLTAGDHTLVIKLDTAAIPAHFRAEVPEARFHTE